MSQVIINDVPPYTQAQVTSNGEVVFGTNWTANVASDVVVYYTPVGIEPDDETQILSFPSQYNVAFVGSLQEVQITLVGITTSIGDTVTITRNTPADRENLYSNTNFLPSMLNNDFGILTLVDQQAQLVNQFIAPRYNYSSTIVQPLDTILPILEANQVWIKNNNNTGFIALTIQGGQVGSGTVNLGSKNELAYYPSNGNSVSGVPTISNGVVQTAFDGTPIVDTSLPLSITGDDMVLNNPTITNGSITSVTINSSILNNSSLGTPSSGILTNCTGLPSGSGILCTTTNDNASSGQLGEFKSSIISSGSAVTAVSTIPVNVTSISLTSGDWDVWGNVNFVNLGSVTHAVYGWISAISATPPPIPDASLFSGLNASTNTLFTFLNGTGFSVPFQRFSLSTTTTIYLTSVVNSNSNCSVCGGIYARRAR